ncbi:MAG: acyl-CoA dehydrogenase family protein, partial [Bradyrhizobium sp.]
FAALRDDFSALREKGPLYGITTYTMFGLGFGAVALGVARATLDAAIDLARKKHSVGITAMKDNSAVQGLIGRTEAKLRAARAYHFSTAAEAWQELLSTGRLSEDRRAAIRLSATWTIHQAVEVVDTAYHMAGATAVFKSNPFERRFRDIHAIAQQIQSRDTHYEDVGKRILTNSAIPRGPTI